MTDKLVGMGSGFLFMLIGLANLFHIPILFHDITYFAIIVMGFCEINLYLWDYIAEQQEVEQ